MRANVSHPTPCMAVYTQRRPCAPAGAGATPAVAAAVLDALEPLGVTELDMPLTPLRVWQAIQEGGGA